VEVVGRLGCEDERGGEADLVLGLGMVFVERRFKGEYCDSTRSARFGIHT